MGVRHAYCVPAPDLCTRRAGGTLCYMLGGMVQRDPWLEHYGARRRDPLRPRRLRLALVLAGALAVVVGTLVVVASRDCVWRPPRGLRGFAPGSPRGRAGGPLPCLGRPPRRRN